MTITLEEAAEGEKIMREAMAEWYGVVDVYERPADETVKKYLAVIKRLHEFCLEIGLSDSPPGPGTVASFLHHLALTEGEGCLQTAVDAISFSAQLNETYDATKHPIVKEGVRRRSAAE
jgi:hypothetical protein